MFKIAQFEAAQTELAKRVTALEEMRNDPELKRELEFDGELVSLLNKYSLSKDKLFAFLSVQYNARKAADKKAAGPKKAKSHHGTMKLWSNPHTGEKLESGRRDHLTIKGWIEQYGLKEVLTWATPV